VQIKGLFINPIPLTPFPLSRGRGSEGKRGGEAPSLKPLPPLLFKERGIKGVRLTKLANNRRDKV
jgi:hypothetical protein